MSWKPIAASSLLAVFIFLVRPTIATQGQAPSTVAQGDRTVVALLRLVNTSELTYKGQQSGRFAPWDDLVGSAQFRKVLDEQGEHMGADLRNAQFSDPANIMRGWSLRLFVSQDFQHYVVTVAGATSSPCSPMFLTDDQGLIRRAQTIGCGKP